jgi:hypothetical protein
VQSFTWCFPVAFDPTPGADHTIDKPEQYDRWRNYTPHLTPPWPGKMFSWTYTHPRTLEPITRTLFSQQAAAGQTDFWNYRKIIRRDIYLPGHEPHEATIVNWPMNDYWEQNIIDQPQDVVDRAFEESRQLSLSFLYWLQTEAPRADGKTGYPNLYPAAEIMGTKDGLAKAPYIRESRRIKAVFTVTENHVGADARKPEKTAATFDNSVGVGFYRIDLHPTTAGNNYLDIASLRFQIPLGALLPVRMENLLPACKNIGTTHITNGCYRLHPVEWNIGESAGLLAGFCIDKNVKPREVREKKELLGDFQKLLEAQGVQLKWDEAR